MKEYKIYFSYSELDNSAMSEDIMPAESVVEDEAAPYLSNIDFFILSLMAGMAVYWFFFKNKQKEQPTFKKLTVAYVSTSGYS